MKVLVTGGAGFIGSNVVAALEERGDEVAAADTFGFPGQWKNLAKRTGVDVHADQVWEGDVSAIVHMAAISSPAETDTEKVLEANLHISQRLWHVAERLNVPFIYASSAGVYGNGNGPLTPYAWSKLLFDRWVERQETTPPSWAGLRFTNVYGPNEYHKPDPSPICSWWHKRKATVYQHESHPDAGRDFVYVDDVVDVVLWALDHGKLGGIFDVGTGSSTTWLKMARLFNEASSVPEAFLDFAESRRFPYDLFARYQWDNTADLSRLRAAGYTGAFRSPDVGVHEYVTKYLATEDPYR